jgi:hypothetical protein
VEKHELGGRPWVSLPGWNGCSCRQVQEGKKDMRAIYENMLLLCGMRVCEREGEDVVEME